MLVTHIREKCPLLAHERKTPNQRYSGPGSLHPETSNSTRQHPAKLQPSVNNCLCIQVKTEKKSSTAMSGSVQCACSHNQFTIQCYWGRRGSRSCRSSPRASVLWIAYVRVKWFPTDCALALPLSRSLARRVSHTRTSFWIVEGGALWYVLVWTPQQNLIRIYPNISKSQCCHVRLL